MGNILLRLVDKIESLDIPTAPAYRNRMGPPARGYASTPKENAYYPKLEIKELRPGKSVEIAGSPLAVN